MFASRWPVYLRPHGYAESPTAFRLTISALTGAALAFSYTGFYLAAYSSVSVGLLMIMTFGARPWVAALCGFLHGIVYVFVALPWIATVLKVHGGLNAPAAAGVLTLIACAWAAGTAAFSLGTGWLARRSIHRACLAAPFLWVAQEFARTHLPEVGFPWNLLGYPATRNLALVQLTSVAGIFGLSLLVAAYNALLAWADAADDVPARRRWAILGAATAALLGIALLGPRGVPVQPAHHLARVVQPNFPEATSYSESWLDAHAGELDELERMSVAPSRNGRPQPDLIVWPEVPAPFSFEDPKFAARAGRIAQSAGRPFLAGAIEWKTEREAGGRPQLAPFNSAVMVNAQGARIFTYDKIRLVPFGEYEPFPLIQRVVAHFSDEVGGFHPGSAHAVGRFSSAGRFSAFICYEAVFGDEVRRFASGGANLFVNISNDGWFGRSAAPEQHLQMARVRAVENRRWMLRATNNGHTVAIDPYGRIVAGLSPDIRAALDAPYDYRTDVTPYTRWGDWLAWLSVIAAGAFLAGAGWRRSSARPAGTSKRDKDNT